MVASFAVQLSTHDFGLNFCNCLGPLSSGDSVFLPYVLVPGAPETRGIARFFFFFFLLANNGGQRACCKNLLRNTGGRRASNMLSPVFFSPVGSWGVFSARNFFFLLLCFGPDRSKKKQQKQEQKEV